MGEAHLGLLGELEKKFVSALNSNDLFFFVGSGVSIVSGLPGAYKILGATLKRVLQESFLAHSDGSGSVLSVPLEQFLPEEVYSVLLKWDQYASCCLDVFKSLLSTDLSGNPQPNYVHVFVALAASRSGLPVFTVNFDCMFEMACEELGLSYRVYSYDDVERFERDSEADSPYDYVRICKVHGTTGGCDGRSLTPNDIMSTSRDISKPNGWAGIISNLFHRHSLALLGYSGRDIDLYPFIRSTAVERFESDKEGSPHLFWFDELSSEDMKKVLPPKIRECHGGLIKQYPNNAFPKYQNLVKWEPELQKWESLQGNSDARCSSGSTDEALEYYVGQLPVLQAPCRSAICLELLVKRQKFIPAGVFAASGFSAEKVGEALADNTVDLSTYGTDWLHDVDSPRNVSTLYSLMVLAKHFGDESSYRGFARRISRIIRRELFSCARRGEVDRGVIGRKVLDILWLDAEALSSFCIGIPSLEFPLPRDERALLRSLSAVYALLAEMRYAWLLLRFSLLGRMLPPSMKQDWRFAFQEVRNRELAHAFSIVVHLPEWIPFKRLLYGRQTDRLLNLSDEALEDMNTNTLKGLRRRVVKTGLVSDERFEDFLTCTGELFDTFPDDDQYASSLITSGDRKEIKKGLERMGEVGSTLGTVKGLIKLAAQHCSEGEKDCVLSNEDCDALNRLIARPPFRAKYPFLLRRYFDACLRQIKAKQPKEEA